MDNRNYTWLTYLEYLYRIGRQVGYKTEAQSESLKMTEAEQIKLTGLIMVKDKEAPALSVCADLEYMFIDDNEQNQKQFIKRVQEKYINHYYEQIEKLLANCQQEPRNGF